MRFDEVSAVYALFGTFQVGVRLPLERLATGSKESLRPSGAGLRFASRSDVFGIRPPTLLESA